MFDQSGIDPRMVPSIAPRAGRPAVDAPDVVGDDPLNESHREWDTGGEDLQFACTFALPQPVPPYEPTRCVAGSDAPLCAPGPRDSDRQQVRDGAHPAPRVLAVAEALGRQAVVGSACPRTTSDPTAAGFGYKPALDLLADRFARGLRR